MPIVFLRSSDLSREVRRRTIDSHVRVFLSVLFTGDGQHENIAADGRDPYHLEPDRKQPLNSLQRPDHDFSRTHLSCVLRLHHRRLGLG